FRRGRLAVLSDRHLGEQVQALLVVGLGFGRIGGNHLVPHRNSLIRLARLRINFGKVVIVGSQLLVIVSLFLGRFGGGAQVDGLLIIGCGHFEALLFFSGIGLLWSRHAVSIGQFEPDQIAGAVDLVAFGQRGDCGFVISRIGGHLGGAKLFVERAHRLLFGGVFGNGFVLLRRLFGGHSGCGGVLLLQVEVLRRFIYTHRKAL